jgi:hypothetical protein
VSPPGTLALAADVAWIDMAESGVDVVYATALPDGPPLVLSGTAGLIFVAAQEGGTAEEIVDRVAHGADATAGEVRADVLGFLDHLVTLGLLTRTP